jgi:hypothetical protein
VWPHHARAIERWVAYAQQQPEHLAIVVAGSLTKGWARPDSDVDGLIVVTDAEFERRYASGDLTFWSVEFCDYDGGYVDAKYVNRAFIEAVAERGTEPARSAFTGALVPWTLIDDLPALVARAAEYPDAGREERMATFWAQVQTMQWYVGEADRRDDPYLRAWAASRLALFACRLVLAHNRALFPYHKWLLRAVEEQANDKPDGFVALVRDATTSPGPATAEALVLSLLLFRDWPSAGNWSTRFLLDTEWAWLRGPVGPDEM